MGQYLTETLLVTWIMLGTWGYIGHIGLYVSHRAISDQLRFYWTHWGCIIELLFYLWGCIRHIGAVLETGLYLTHRAICFCFDISSHCFTIIQAVLAH